ncbi:MAG: hypothetical protein ACKVY0_13740 [Prosthecobacter sp.]|uniref:hypothetical protein n=1 Tax=Prosthecobacter sp. TaxID=1965333 RepID=UPI0038FD755D
MNALAKAFMEWAQEPQRTADERFSVLLLLEIHAPEFYPRNGLELHRQREARRYNAAWMPVLNEAALRVVAGKLEEIREYPFWQDCDRTLRSVEVVRFLPGLKKLKVLGEVPDLEPLRYLPGLEELVVNGEVTDLSCLRHVPDLKSLWLGCARLEDYRPVALCRRLRVLQVRCTFPWPCIEGWEVLEELEEMAWEGSALGFLSLKRLPGLRKLTLNCGQPNGEGGLRDFHQLPEMPQLRELDARHFFYLDGIERCSALLNVRVTGPFRTAAPVAALPVLTHLTLECDELREVKSLRHAPALHVLRVKGRRPQDYSGLEESPNLREVRAEGCETPQVDLDMLRVLLPDWDEYFAAAMPRALGELCWHILEPPQAAWPEMSYPENVTDWQANRGFQQSEHAWVERRLQAALEACGLTREEGCRVGGYHHGVYRDGTPRPPFEGGPGQGKRCTTLWLLGLRTIGRFREVVDCARTTFAGLRHPWAVHIMGEPSPGDEMMGRPWVTDDDDESMRQYYREKQRKERELLAQELRLKLLREEGIEPDEKDFRLPPPPKPETGGGKGGTTTTTKPAEDEKPPMKFDAPNLDWNNRDEDDDAGGLKEADPDDEEEDEQWLPMPPKMNPNVFWDGLNLYLVLTEDTLYVYEKGREVVEYLLTLENGSGGA